MESYLGEIRMFAGQKAPEDWAFCDGSLLNVNSNTALFSLLGTTFGGDGQVNFALPDLRGRIPISSGTGAGLTPRTLGSFGGSQTVTVVEAQMPVHTHPFYAANTPATTLIPNNALLADVSAVSLPNPNPGQPTLPLQIYQDPPSSPLGPLHNAAVTSTGQNGGHDNIMPSFCVNFIICINGLFPSSS